MIWIKIILPVILIGWFIKFRRRTISEKIKKIEISETNEKELRILASKCWERAQSDGVWLPRKDVAVCKLSNDPYTWVIIKLGIWNREIYRCRMSLDDVAEARLEAKEEEL